MSIRIAAKIGQFGEVQSAALTAEPAHITPEAKVAAAHNIGCREESGGAEIANGGADAGGGAIEGAAAKAGRVYRTSCIRKLYQRQISGVCWHNPISSY